jgi:hypothetical protein
MADWVRAKPWLGLLGNISACMGTAAAFGVTIYLGVEFIGINLAAPFLMLGKWQPHEALICSHLTYAEKPAQLHVPCPYRVRAQ